MKFSHVVANGLGPLKVALRALRHRNFRIFFMGQSVSLIGTWMQSTALSWLVYRMTGSKMLLGVVAFASMIPMSVLTPIAGVISDRVDRRPILIITQTLAMLQAFVLSALVMTDVIRVWQIIVLGVFAGLVVAFDMPARQAFVVEMIEDRRDLGNAIALNSLMFNGARFVGPALAGVLIKVFSTGGPDFEGPALLVQGLTFPPTLGATLLAVFAVEGRGGEGPVFFLNALTFLAVIASYFAMKLRPVRRARRDTNLLSELAEGVRYVFRIPAMRAILLLVAFLSLVSMPYQTLMPVVARDVLHGTSRTYGGLLTSVGLGAMVGAIFLASRRDVTGFATKILGASLLMGVALIAFALSRVFWLSAALMTVVGFCVMVQVAASNTVVQTMVSDDKRGRLMGLFGLSFLGVAPFGHLIAGALAQKIGAPATLLISGILSTLAAAVFSMNLRTVARMAHHIPAENGVPEEIATGIRAAALGNPPGSSSDDGPSTP